MYVPDRGDPMRMTTSCLCVLVACVLFMATDVTRADCVFESNTYKTNQTIKLKDDCFVAVVCQPNGRTANVRRAVTKRCPINTRCANNVCKCYSPLVVETRDSSGMVATCKHPSQCKHEGEYHSNTFEWISKDCQNRYRCDYGTVKRLWRHTCPAHSVCNNNGDCECKGFYRTGSMGRHFILRNCVKTTYNTERKICSDGVKEYKLDEHWLQSDCKKRIRCTIAGILSLRGDAYSCPKGTACNNNGKCE